MSSTTAEIGNVETAQKNHWLIVGGASLGTVFEW